MNKLKTALMISAAFAFAAPAFAQDGAITLQVNSGSVMTSNGGEFVSAASGAMLAPGQKLMVSAGSSATAVYSNGCRTEFNAPGTYDVPATCAGVTNTGSHGSIGMAAAVTVGAAAIAAAAIGSKSKVPPQSLQPISGGGFH